MKIIRFVKGGELIQLGIEKKDLYLKWGQAPKPMKLGQLREIKALGLQPDITLDGKTVKVPSIVKAMAKAITSGGILLADKYTNEEFYRDFLNDYKEMDAEGELKFLGEFDEWA